MEAIKIDKNLDSFDIKSFNTFMSMFFIIACGPVIGIIVMLKK